MGDNNGNGGGGSSGPPPGFTEAEYKKLRKHLTKAVDETTRAILELDEVAAAYDWYKEE